MKKTEINGLKELFKIVCLEKNGNIKISCSGSQGGLYWDVGYNIESDDFEYEADGDEIEILCDETWSKLSDYPEDKTEWKITRNEVEINIVGISLDKDKDESEDDFYDRNMNTYNLSINEFNKIFKLSQ